MSSGSDLEWRNTYQRKGRIIDWRVWAAFLFWAALWTTLKEGGALKKFPGHQDPTYL